MGESTTEGESHGDNQLHLRHAAPIVPRVVNDAFSHTVFILHHRRLRSMRIAHLHMPWLKRAHAPSRPYLKLIVHSNVHAAEDPLDAHRVLHTQVDPCSARRCRA